MVARAKNPDRVLDKVREARFFLVQMASYEQALDTEKFLYCLNAFISAFRTIAFRLYGVTENLSGPGGKRTLKCQLHGHAEIKFPVERTNVELHEDGVVVFQRYTTQVSSPEPSRFRSMPQKFRTHKIGVGRSHQSGVRNSDSSSATSLFL